MPRAGASLWRRYADAMNASGGPVVLCCLLWARPGCEGDLASYESAVLGIIKDSGGEVVQRAVGDGADGRPHEVHILRFPSAAALDEFREDPRRAAWAEERDRAVARTEVFPVEIRVEPGLAR